MKTDDIDRMVGRLQDNLSSSWTSCIYAAIEELEPICESPIEIMLAAALLIDFSIGEGIRKTEAPFIRLQLQNEINLEDAIVVLVPQYKWEGYRIDFAICSKYVDGPIFVECDGHDFHERTKDQAARDRLKDREIQQAGIPILRFTGSEIYRDPGKCGHQIITFVSSRLRTGGQNDG